MAEADFRMQRHDRLPSIQATLSADLTGAASVKFIMRPAIGDPEAPADWVPDFGVAATVNTTATIVTPASGIVRYDWLAIDTAVAGPYLGQWQVTWTSGSKPQTFPTDTYHTILIRADLDDA